MIKLKTLLTESIFNIEDYRKPLLDYISNMFKNEYDERQLLMFGLSMDEFKNKFVDKILNYEVEHFPERWVGAGPSGECSYRQDRIDISYSIKNYKRSKSYKSATDSVLFHELIHAVDLHKKLWDNITYEKVKPSLGNRYYGDPEEIRAYGAELKYYLVRFLGFSRKDAETLMKRYVAGIKYGPKWISKYYDLIPEVQP